MHGNVVPAEEQLPASERAVGFLPIRQELIQHAIYEPVEFVEAAPEQDAQIDALSVVVQLPPINNEPRRPRKGLRSPEFIE